MTQYINKADAVAEIEKRLHKYEQEYEELARHEIWITAKEIEHKIKGLKEALSILDTFEVKEIDLEKEIKDYLRQQPIVARSQGTNLQLVPSPIEIARYAFELGLKAQKENNL